MAYRLSDTAADFNFSYSVSTLSFMYFLSRAYPTDCLSSVSDQFEEEETKTMTEPTMKEYMTKSRDGYESRISRPKIDEKALFELKVQFLKELCDNNFSGSNNEYANEHIEKVLEIIHLFHILNITQDREVISFYKGLDVPTRQILDSKGVIPSMKVTDAKKAVQEMVDHS
nr:hypothetical protein [Tanacetum cinerariifolium]